MKIAVVGLTCILLVGCATPSAVNDRRLAVALMIEQVKSDLSELSLEVVPVPSRQATEYFKYYGLMPTGAVHFFGTFLSGGNQLVAHVYRPRNSQGSVILVHGYYDHAGIWKNLLYHLLSRHYTVAIFELPGHGLSGGDRVSIRCFSEYRTAVRDFVSLCQKNLDGPFHIVAHSMGAGVTADYFLSCETGTLDGKVVFLAPLIRPAHARISRFGLAMVSPFCSSIPRWFRRNSSDEAFLQFVKDDPLQERHLPLAFCRAMHAWYKNMPDREPTEREVLIIQGTSDTTVNWRFNRRFMKKKLPNAEFELVPDAGHQLANESDTPRSKVFGLIDVYIQGSHLEPKHDVGSERPDSNQSMHTDREIAPLSSAIPGG